jgi:glucose-6-phosphate dehydrogenase assembly protein OpcA
VLILAVGWLAALLGRVRRRQEFGHLFRELVATEQAYVASLHEFVAVLKTPLYP